MLCLGQEKEIEQLVHTAIPELEQYDIDLELVYEKNAKASKHYTFALEFEGFSLFNNFIKVSTDWNGKLISLKKEIYPLNELDMELFRHQALIWNKDEHFKGHFPGKNISEKELTIYDLNGEFQLVYMLKSWSERHDETKLISLENEVVAHWNHQSRAKIDTIVNTKVFSPDPLTKGAFVYGGTFVDNNDTNSAWFNALYDSLSFSARYDDVLGIFLLENEYLLMQDIEGPSNTVSTSTTPNFYYNRSQQGFEECMIMYHVGEFQKHINLLGYDSLMDLQLKADAHGQFNQDNSVFNRNGGNPNIIFGDGGVDDAEDADVIIHEYCHGISWDANMNSNFTFERNALDEGSADYFATSYSRNLSPFRYADMFTWDGHNEFWDGRSANSTDQYDAPFNGNFYDLGSVWNTALQLIYTDIGRNSTDELVLETLYFLNNNSTLPEAAHFMLQADSLLNGGANVGILCNRFQQKNILDASCLPVGIKSVAIQDEGFRLLNSFGFTNYRENLGILTPRGNYQLNIYDISGRKLRTAEFIQAERITIEAGKLRSGVYILELLGEKGRFSTKISLGKSH